MLGYDEEEDYIDYPELNEIYTSDEDEMEFRRRNSSNTHNIYNPVENTRPHFHYQSSGSIRTRNRKIINTRRYSRKSVKPNLDNNVCAICLDIMIKEDVRNLVFCSSQCGYIYHRKCIMLWGKKQNNSNSSHIKCPTCRTFSNFKRPKMVAFHFT